MSRIAKNPITIPDSASVTVDNKIVKVKGVKGELDFNISSLVSLEINENVITVSYDEENQQSIGLAGYSWWIVNYFVGQWVGNDVLFVVGFFSGTDLYYCEV